MLRMGNDRLTKALVLGWYECLDGRSKMIERRRVSAVASWICTRFVIMWSGFNPGHWLLCLGDKRPS